MPNGLTRRLSCVGVPVSNGNVPQCIGTTCRTPSHWHALGRRHGIHREAIADRQEGDVRPVHLADQPHVAEQTGIARVVQGPPVLEPHHEPRRFAHVDHLAVVEEAAAVPRVGHRDAQSGDLLDAALVHRRHVLDSLAPKPVAQLERCHDRAPAVAGHVHEVADVIEVAV